MLLLSISPGVPHSPAMWIVVVGEGGAREMLLFPIWRGGASHPCDVDPNSQGERGRCYYSPYGGVCLTLLLYVD